MRGARLKPTLRAVGERVLGEVVMVAGRVGARAAARAYESALSDVVAIGKQAEAAVRKKVKVVEDRLEELKSFIDPPWDDEENDRGKDRR